MPEIENDEQYESAMKRIVDLMDMLDITDMQKIELDLLVSSVQEYERENSST